MKIGIVKYSANNVGSLVACINKLSSDINFTIEIIDGGNGVDPCSFDRLIIPGVGNFASGAEFLITKFGKNFFSDALHSGTRVLGICLGFQLLFQSSEEGRQSHGLGFIEDVVRRFPDKPFSPPNFGWRDVYQNSNLIDKFYLVHSYYVEPTNGDWVSSFNNIEFCVMRKVDNLWGTQFHPEISGKKGSQFLADFISND